MSLADARERIGAYVVYRSPGTGKSETGVITSVSDHFVFVRYGSQWSSEATPAECLTFAGGAS
jgi:hypothetical protein